MTGTGNTAKRPAFNLRVAVRESLRSDGQVRAYKSVQAVHGAQHEQIRDPGSAGADRGAAIVVEVRIADNGKSHSKGSSACLGLCGI